ncbi:MAG: transcription elongation factor GreA [Coriobacteriales bacterium]|nr:transcription elongation factor GreA [Coriobacteriales bacterium]
MAQENELILTQEGMDALEKELDELENVKRAEISERIKVAREFGDISENSEYDDAKNEQAFNESRIAEIRQILSTAKLAPANKTASKVGVGSKVLVQDVKGNEREYTIVGSAEADAKAGKISNESAFGQALMGKKPGDDIEYDGPTGRKMRFKFIKLVK